MLLTIQPNKPILPQVQWGNSETVKDTKMIKTLKALIKDESGATAIEYGLLIALVSLALIGGATVIGEQISAIFTDVGTELTGTTVNTGN